MQYTIKTSDLEPIASTLLEEEPDLVDLVAKFVEHLPNRIADINSAATAQDWPSLKQQLHALKGLSANFGYPGLSRLIQQIEDTLSHQRTADIAPSIEELTALCQRVTVGGTTPRML